METGLTLSFYSIAIDFVVEKVQLINSLVGSRVMMFIFTTENMSRSQTHIRLHLTMNLENNNNNNNAIKLSTNFIRLYGSSTSLVLTHQLQDIINLNITLYVRRHLDFGQYYHTCGRGLCTVQSASCHVM